MTPLQLLEEIKIDFVEKFDNDPQIKRVCNVIINEFKERKHLLNIKNAS